MKNDRITITRITLKLVLVMALLAMLMLLSTSEVDFVYTGF